MLKEAGPHKAPGIIPALWRRRRGVARLAVAVGLLTLSVGDQSARLARLECARLQDMDYVAEARKLRGVGRYPDALLVLDAAESQRRVDPSAVAAERAAIVAERDSYLRRAKDFAKGALLGRGDSLETAAGAIAADMFVVGDLRDMLIEGSKHIVGGDPDDFVLVLSAAGVATTVVPYFDWSAALLKFAHKMGRLSTPLVKTIKGLCKAAVKERRTEGLGRFVRDLKHVADAASPGTAIRILRHIDEPKELEAVANFLSRNSKGAFALIVTDKTGVDLVKRAAVADEAVVRAARKGQAGSDWLQKYGSCFRPHPLIGLGKACLKGTAQSAFWSSLEAALDRFGWCVPGALALWAAIEGTVLYRHVRRWRATRATGV